MDIYRLKNQDTYWMVALHNSYRMIFGLCFLLLVAACGGDDEMMSEKEITEFPEGIFVVNRGNDDVANGTISFYQRECEQVVDNIYLKANLSPQLGNDLRDMVFIGAEGFVLSNNSNRLTIVNADDFTFIASIEGFENPQNLLVVNPNKIYVSQWGADGLTGSIEVIDVQSRSIIASIPTPGGPGKMISQGPAVFVANSGGFAPDSLLSKIDATSDLFLKTIQVGVNPVDLVEDQEGGIWTLCGGVLVNFQNPMGPENTPGRLVRVSNDRAELAFPLTAGARNLVINNTGDQLYFVNNNWTYQHGIRQTSLSQVPFLDLSFNGYAVDPQSGLLLAANALDFKKRGEIVLFDLNTATSVDTFAAGIIPTTFSFR